uniref:(northern house mosquito) hypothetical protein n=1 Tax=Culex pipiens TaxID=7175 RepID=A0A8D8FT62_CULPI
MGHRLRPAKTQRQTGPNRARLWRRRPRQLLRPKVPPLDEADPALLPAHLQHGRILRRQAAKVLRRHPQDPAGRGRGSRRRRRKGVRHRRPRQRRSDRTATPEEDRQTRLVLQGHHREAEEGTRRSEPRRQGV